MKKFTVITILIFAMIICLGLTSCAKENSENLSSLQSTHSDSDSSGIELPDENFEEETSDKENSKQNTASSNINQNNTSQSFDQNDETSSNTVIDEEQESTSSDETPSNVFEDDDSVELPIDKW